MFQDTEALKLLGFKPGMVVNWKTVSDKIPQILEEWKARFCLDCGYREVCFVR